MTPGIAFFYGGMVRTKHVLTMIMQNFLVIALVSVTWIAVSYSLAFGKGNRLIGDLHFSFLAHMNEAVPGYTGMVIPPLVFVIFQMMFAVITPALITGSTADRWRFDAFVPFVVLWSILVYAPVAHWVFSPLGWAEHIGHTRALDFAGGTVVHANAGAAGLAMALVLGRRRNLPKPPVLPEDRDRMRPHNLPFVMLGTALLWFGWFGFNAGSALTPNGHTADTQLAAYAFVNTNTATAVAMLTWVFIERLTAGRATTLGAASGAVAGLVAITPCAGFVSPVGAMAVGVISALGCGVAVSLKTRLGYDDALDVAGLHLVGGVIGSLGVGLFATTAVNADGSNGLFYHGGLQQLTAQGITVLAVVAYSFVVTYLLGRLLGAILPNGGRVTASQEEEGLDRSLLGESAYAG
jgi:Amt family ammonium transporter